MVLLLWKKLFKNGVKPHMGKVNRRTLSEKTSSRTTCKEETHFINQRIRKTTTCMHSVYTHRKNSGNTNIKILTVVIFKE